MTFCLDTTIIKPEDNKEIKSAIILLHGYGGDGKDISMLSLNWKRYLPNTIFICPNGHESCSINPSGFQWFDLTKDDPKYILEQSIKAENKLNHFVDEVKNKFNLKNDKICLSGFMMIVSRQNVIPNYLCFFIFKTPYNTNMISGTILKILSIVLLITVGIVLILGIGTLFKGGETSKKYSNKLMQLRVLLQFIAIIALVGFAYFFKN